ncbi:MAG: hypothetical protein RJA70_304 [Pseudomonadota bacterium]|jgi:hypothetical protein
MGALTLGLLSLPAEGVAGPVKGRVTGFLELLNPVWEEAKAPDAHGYTFREPSPTVQAERRKLYPHVPRELCVAILAATAQPKMPTQVVRLGGGRTTPVTLVVTPGTELHFKNTDPFPHRLYGVNVKSFNAADTQKGGDRIWSVPGPGVYEIRDELVPSVRMWVVSEPNVVAFGFPSLSGAFEVEVPVAGSFEVQPFFTGKKIGNAVPLALSATSQTVDLSRTPISVAPKAEVAK